MVTYIATIKGDLTTAEFWITYGVDPSVTPPKQVLLNAEGPLDRTVRGGPTYRTEVIIDDGQLPSALIFDMRGGYSAKWAIELSKKGSSAKPTKASGFIGDTGLGLNETKILKLS